MPDLRVGKNKSYISLSERHKMSSILVSAKSDYGESSSSLDLWLNAPLHRVVSRCESSLSVCSLGSSAVWKTTTAAAVAQGCTGNSASGSPQRYLRASAPCAVAEARKGRLLALYMYSSSL
ncbi:hypothetical protein TKK_0010990 [Trichogramma kaykai]